MDANARVKKLSYYVSEHDVAEALNKLEEASAAGNGHDLADHYILMWEPVSFKLTVDELLDMVDEIEIPINLEKKS